MKNNAFKTITLFAILMFVKEIDAQEFLSWGILKVAVPKKIGQLARSISVEEVKVTSGFYQCFKRLSSIAKDQYGSNKGLTLSQHIGLAGADKTAVIVNLLEEIGGFVVLSKTKTPVFLNQKHLKENIPMIPHQLDQENSPNPILFLKREGFFYIADFDYLKSIGLENLSQLQKNVLSEVPINQALLDALTQKLIRYLEEFHLNFLERLKISKESQRHDYHGLAELSGLAFCRKAFQYQGEYAQLAEGYMTRINPRWQSLMEIDTTKEKEKATISKNEKLPETILPKKSGIKKDLKSGNP